MRAEEKTSTSIACRRVKKRPPVKNKKKEGKEGDNKDTQSSPVS